MVSCIVTSYNKEKYIRESIDSILSNKETFDDFEIIVVDDCSTDGSREILRDYAERYPDTITLIENENNIGAGASRQIGINHSRGEWISFVDADDYINNDFFKTLYSYCVDYDCDMAFGTYVAFTDKGKVRKVVDIISHENGIYTDMDELIVHAGKYKIQFLNVSLCRSSIYKEVGYCMSKLLEDTPTSVCVVSKCKRVYLSDYEGFNYRQVDGSLMHANSKLKRTLYLVYNLTWSFDKIKDDRPNAVKKCIVGIRDMIYRYASEYLFDADEYRKVNEDMWDEVADYYGVDESVMSERKRYALEHMHKPIKIKVRKNK